jgi:hypothetical protein
MKNLILFFSFLLWYANSFAQEKTSLIGKIQNENGMLYENVQVYVFNEDSTMDSHMEPDTFGNYSLNLVPKKKYIVNIYSNEQLINASTIQLISNKNAYLDFIVPFPTNVVIAKKSVMSAPNRMDAKQLESMASNSTTAAIANKPGYFINKESEGIKIPADANHQPVYMIDGVRVSNNSGSIQLPGGSVQSIEVIR